MKVKEVQVIRSVLSRRIGWLWPVILFRALAKKSTLFGKTRWARIRGAESEFVRRLSLASAFYMELKERIGAEEAFEVMREIIVPIGCSEQWGHLNSLNLTGGAGIERLMAFNDLMDRKGASRFNSREYVRQDEGICHFVITRCAFNDFFTEAGTPELTKLFCEVDRRFFPEAFPEFRFHRGGSWENTIAYGKDHCEFVFEEKDV